MASPSASEVALHPENLWVPSTVTEEDLLAMVEEKVLPERSIIEWRPAVNNSFPSPDTGEIVVFESFFRRGFGLPLSPFARDILAFYGLELVHLNPNSILHLSIFVHLCEAYLAIRPHFALFKHLFTVRLSGNHTVAGAVGIQLRSGRAGDYVDVPLPSSLKGWNSGWFYISNPCPPLPEFKGLPAVSRKCWTEGPTDREMVKVGKLLEKIVALKREGLTGVAVAASFVLRRVKPLKERVIAGQDFQGTDDPTREAADGWENQEDVFRVVGPLFKRGTVLSTEGCPLPYSVARPADEVCLVSLSCFLLCRIYLDRVEADLVRRFPRSSAPTSRLRRSSLSRRAAPSSAKGKRSPPGVLP
jgi:hypothetical protein